MSESPVRRRRAVAAVVVVGLAGVAVATGVVIFGRGEESPSPMDHSVTSQEGAIQRAVESLRPGDPAGFDADSWSAAVNTDQVLPPGATLAVQPDSVIVTGDEATVDVVMAVPGQPDSQSWVFLRKVSGDWVVYGSLPLEVEW